MGALLLALTPAIALACDDDSKVTSASASATTSSSATSSTVETPVIKVKSGCKVKVTTTCNNKSTFQFNFNTEAAHKPSWTPGHLIEPDSMKLNPSEEPEIKNAEWVTISYANGAIQSIKKGERSKKSRTAARPTTGAVGPAVQSAPNPY